MITETLAAMGLFWFCFTFGVLFIVMLVAVSTEHHIWAGAALAFTGGLMWLIGGPPDFSFLTLYPLHTVGAVVGYFVAGVVWSCLKWYLFLVDQKEAGAHRPFARHHKSTIVSWMMYWPLSVIGSFLKDFVRRAWNAVYNYISGFFDKIGDSVFGPSVEEKK